MKMLSLYHAVLIEKKIIKLIKGQVCPKNENSALLFKRFNS